MTEQTLSQRQKKHYDSIIDEYDQHYYDLMSLKYRDRFFFDKLFENFDLNGKRVADLASGSGYNSLAILERFPNAETFGVDISEQACKQYIKNVSRPAYCLDLTDANAEIPEPADAAIIIGGIHHCVSDLNGTFKNLSKLIKPGGHLLMMEPNANFCLNFLRMYWYQKSKYFDYQTEEPLVHDEILHMASDSFEKDFCQHMGGPSYFLTLNSLITRTPLWMKKVIYYGLLIPEIIWNMAPFSPLHPYFVARWKRK